MGPLNWVELELWAFVEEFSGRLVAESISTLQWLVTCFSMCPKELYVPLQTKSGLNGSMEDTDRNGTVEL